MSPLLARYSMLARLVCGETRGTWQEEEHMSGSNAHNHLRPVAGSTRNPQGRCPCWVQRATPCTLRQVRSRTAPSGPGAPALRPCDHHDPPAHLDAVHGEREADDVHCRQHRHRDERVLPEALVHLGAGRPGGSTHA